MVKCPHCGVAFFDDPHRAELCQLEKSYWDAICRICPSCNRVIVELEETETEYAYDPQDYAPIRSYATDGVRSFIAYPKGGVQRVCPAAVPEAIAEDFREACLVLSDSPKASAALSRRCLQHLLREVACVKPGTLADEIQELIDRPGVPTHIVDSIDAVRHVGNFAAHPMKSTNSGEIVDVEPEEAEWNLDVLEALFDFLIVQPELLSKKRAALDHKLSGVGKGRMKGARK